MEESYLYIFGVLNHISEESLYNHDELTVKSILQHGIEITCLKVWIEM